MSTFREWRAAGVGEVKTDASGAQTVRGYDGAWYPFDAEWLRYRFGDMWVYLPDAYRQRGGSDPLRTLAPRRGP